METVRVGQLYIDRSEVTIAQFAHYTAATGIRTQAEQTGGGFEYEAGWQKRPGWYWRAPDGQTDADPRLPAVHITHTEAAAYCQWRQGRLPTAQEWLNAAFTEQRSQPSQGLQTGRTYPWPTGDSPHGANTVDNKTWPRAAPAGATQAGVNGLYDMGANVWEWVADSRQGESRTMGGSWWYGSYQMRAEVQAWKPSDFYAVYIGFRCVYDAKPGLGIAGPKSGFM
jgi:sulfatase modifying factor 1